MDQNLNQSNLRYIRLSGKWTKTWFKANREVLWGRTFGKFCNDCGERGKHRNKLKYCYGSSILIKRGGGERKGKPVHFFFFTLGAAAVSAPDSRALPACATHPAHLLPCLFGDGNGATRGSLEAVHLAASSQTSSSAERRPAHPGELVRLAHHYRHIVGRPPSLRPLGKRCRLVSLIFALFSPWAGAKKCREAARQQAETGGKSPQCILTTRDESAVRASVTHQNCQLTSVLGRSAGHMQRSQPIRCVCRRCPK